MVSTKSVLNGISRREDDPSTNRSAKNFLVDNHVETRVKHTVLLNRICPDRNTSGRLHGHRPSTATVRHSEQPSIVPRQN